MSKSNTFEDDFLNLILAGTAIANLADNAASSPLTSLYLRLHTAAPAEGGDATSNEISYTGYTGKAIARSGATWSSITNGVATLAAAVDFDEMTGGAGGTATHASVCVAASGAVKYLWSGALTPNLTVATGVIPRVKAGTTITET